MSYILDALRRADSERDRGAVPNLFAQPLPRASIEPGASTERRLALWFAAGGLAVAVIAIALWQLRVPSSLSPMPQPAPLPVPAPTALPAEAAARPFIPAPTRTPEPVRTLRKAASAPAISPATSPATAPPSAAEPRLYARTELPAEIQRALPTLAIGGASYSENAASRMLIINGQVFHEGDKLAPDLVLEQIKLKAAVLRFKGYRYGVSY